MRRRLLLTPTGILAAAALAAAAPAALTACGGPSSARPGGSSSGLDVGIAFAPQQRGAAALEALAVPIEKAKALIDAVPEEERGDFGTSSGDGGRAGGGDSDSGDSADHRRPLAYDLDRDGNIDLLAFPQVMYGPSAGWVVHAVEHGVPRRLFGISGDWADVRVDKGAVALRFEASILAPGEARFSTTLRFAKGAWDPPIKSYAAMQGKIPAPHPPYASFTTRGPAVLRATPEVNDKPNPSEPDPADESLEHTTTLRGNVLATYPAGARGTIVASEGAWRYVAFDPATRPTETTLSHGMDEVGDGDDGPDTAPNTLLSRAWLCGWIAAAEISASS
jgi:hypothetical protein